MAWRPLPREYAIALVRRLCSGEFRLGRRVVAIPASTSPVRWEIGYGTFLLPPKWEMLAPIIAISGLFTFGWTGSVLVGFVSSMNALRAKIDSTIQGVRTST